MKCGAFLFCSFGLSLFGLCAGSACSKADGRTKIVLEVVRSFDERLPFLSDSDMAAVLAEGQAVIAAKLAGDVSLSFRDNGRLSAAALFQEVPYQSTDFYRSIAPFRYDFRRGRASPMYRSVAYRRSLDAFLRAWSLPALAKFFPKDRVRTYAEAADATLRVYHEKLDWLKTLKAPDGSPLLQRPAVPYQSYTEWLAMMRAQKRFDVVFTNTLVVLDTANNPYPHSITKHAKVGGSSFDSPARTVMGGRSVMVNTLEEFGGIAGISRERKVSPDKRNKLVGAVLFAHEFAHAFYLIPDVYDHPASCLMNSTMENLDMEKAYELLWSDRKPCPLCRPYVHSKTLEIRAVALLKSGNYARAGELCLEAARTLPQKLDTDRDARLATLRTCARSAFLRAGLPGRAPKEDGLLKPRSR